MATCPHCKGELRVPPRAENNVYHYGGSALTVTDCCAKPVTVRRVVSYAIEAYDGNKTEDDWGVEFKK